MKTAWCDRALLLAPVYFCLCTTPERFKAELKRLNVVPAKMPAFLGSEHADATTHFLTATFATAKVGAAKVCAVVTMAESKKRSLIEVHALLVHEAMHIWQEVKDLLGERKPSSEFEAYSVQSISQELMCAYQQQTGRKR